MADIEPAEQTLAAVEVREESGALIIWLSGELDMINVGQVGEAIDAALGSHPGQVVLDTSGLEFMDSSGIALLVSLTQRRREIRVRNPTRIVRRLIELSGLSDILQIMS